MNEEQGFAIRRVPAILIVIFLACPLLFLALVTLSLSTWTFDRGFSLGLLSDARLYQLPEAVPGARWTSAVIEGSGGLEWKTVQRAARSVLSADYLRDQAVRIVNQVFDCLDGRAPWSDLSVDARPVKRALQGEAGAQFARLLAEDLPVGGRVGDFRVSPGRLPVSRPSSVTVEQAAAVIRAGLPVFLSSVPDTVRLVDPGAYGAYPRGPAIAPRVVLLLAGLFLLLIGAGFLVGAAFLAGRTADERVRWCGWPLLAPAAGVLLLGLAVIAGASWIPWGLARARLEMNGFSSTFVAALVEAARHAAARVATSFLAAGGIAAGAALGLLAWSWTAPRAEKRAP